MLKELRDYLTIRCSGLFDKDYYLLHYPDIRYADVDPLWHFVNTGWKEGRNPSEFFDLSFYLSANKDVREAGINPLCHFIRFGADELRNPNPIFDTALYVKNRPELLKNKTNPLFHFMKLENRDQILTQEMSIIAVNPKLVKLTDVPNFTSVNDIYWELVGLPETDSVDIIICVGPNPKNINDCVASIEKFTDLKTCQIHLMVDKKHKVNVEKFSAPYIVIHEYSIDRFNYSMVNNLVMRNSQNDIVLLNDDTEVTQDWLVKLREASKGVALTGAHTTPHCSGNPDMWNEGPIVTTRYPINMFCAYIPNRVRQVVGLLDEEFVYYGGEDVDYSIRALKNGFPLVVSDAFVIHKDNGSFGETKEALMRESDKIVLEKYGIHTPFDLSEVKPLVSIIMATHNRSHLLNKVVESIHASVYHNFELIIVDDASQDDTVATVSEIQKKYSNIYYVKLPSNQGLAKARNLGVNLAKGDFLFFTDDDDTVFENRISSPLTWIMNHPDMDVVYCNFALTTNGKEFQISQNSRYNRQEYLELKFAIGSGILLGRIEPFKKVVLFSRYNYAVDYDWVFRLIRAGYKIDLCPDVVMVYNRTGQNDLHLAGTSTASNQHQEVYDREKLLDTLENH